MVKELQSIYNRFEHKFNNLNFYSVKDHSVSYKLFDEHFSSETTAFNKVLSKLQQVITILQTKPVEWVSLTLPLHLYNKICTHKLTRKEYKLLKEFYYGN